MKYIECIRDLFYAAFVRSVIFNDFLESFESVACGFGNERYNLYFTNINWELNPEDLTLGSLPGRDIYRLLYSALVSRVK